MENVQQCLEELTELVSQASGDGQTQTLDKVADLFFLTEDQQTPSDTQTFGRLLEQLAYQVDINERMLLSERMKASRKGPLNLLSRLAGDEIVVARPVLQYSPALADDDLAALAGELGSDHQLAIALRPRVPERVTDILIERGDPSVLGVLLQNAGAELSTDSIAQLRERAKTDERLEQLTQARTEFDGKSFISRLKSAVPDFRVPSLARLSRGGLPDIDLQSVAARSKDAIPEFGPGFFSQLKKRIVALLHSLVFDAVDEEGQNATAAGNGQAAGAAGDASPDGEDDPLDGLVQYAPEGGGDDKQENKSAQFIRDEQNLAKVAREGRVAETISGLAAITETSLDVAESCLFKSKVSALVILCKARRLSSSALLALLEIRASRTGDKSANTVSLLRRYDSIPVGEARQIVETSDDYKSAEPAAEDAG